MKRSFILGVGFAMTLMLALAPARLPGQTTGDFRGFVFDSSFYFGAHGMLFPAIAQDTFHFTFSQTYDGPAGLRWILDSTNWHADAGARWRDSMDRNYYNEAIDRDYRVIFSPHAIRGFQGQMTLSECWYQARPDSNHVIEFDTTIRDKKHGPDPANGVTFDSLFDRHVWGVNVDSLSSPRDTLIAGGARFTRYGAYSAPTRPPVPIEADHRFRSKLTSDSARR